MRTVLAIVCAGALVLSACEAELSPEGGRRDASATATDAADMAVMPAPDARGDAVAAGDALADAGADAVPAADASRDATPADVLVWPNAESHANSDPWLGAHHDAIREMHPRVLAINFDNTATASEFMPHVRGVMAALAEGSRYRGYADASAPPFLRYELAAAVDLSDRGSPPPGWSHLNGSRTPLHCVDPSRSWYQFDYSALFSQAFADQCGIADPANPTHHLTLCELAARGLVHEVWLHVNGDPDPYTCSNGVRLSDFQLPEVLEYKQRYDAAGRAMAGQFDNCAGNGCVSDLDVPAFQACGRSLRVLYINSTRGVGCAVSSLGHGVESTMRHTLTALVPEFIHFANFDLRTRLGLPVDDWYPCGEACVSFTSDNSLRWMLAGRSGTVASYDQGCGSVHFPPNARQNYDTANAQPVRSTCENFGLHNAPDGRDLATPYTNALGRRYDAMAPDCESGWLLYWRQSFPGLDTRARRDDGTRVRNWWPYLFY